MLIIKRLGKIFFSFIRLEPLNPEPETDEFRNKHQHQTRGEEKDEKGQDGVYSFGNYQSPDAFLPRTRSQIYIHPAS